MHNNSFHNHIYDFTLNAEDSAYSVVDKDDFIDNDVEAILAEIVQLTNGPIFSDYLKRYIYKNYPINREYAQVPDVVYHSVIKQNFLQSGTPASMSDSSARLNNAIENWLQRNTVSRDTVFLLGFAFSMNADEVNELLIKGIHEQGMNMKNPYEAIYRFCFDNNYPYEKMVEIKTQFDDIKPQRISENIDTVAAERMLSDSCTQEQLLAYLAQMKSLGDYSSRTTQYSFISLLNDSKIIVANLLMNANSNSRNNVHYNDVSEAKLEKYIYAHTPLDKNGNLLKTEYSSLCKAFGKYRLTRQRMTGIISGEIQITRYDLLTLKFFVMAYEKSCITLPIQQRVHRFQIEADHLLEHCHMGKFNMSHPYEKFLFLCMSTVSPHEVFAEVWERSFDSM